MRRLIPVLLLYVLYLVVPHVTTLFMYVYTLLVNFINR